MICIIRSVKKSVIILNAGRRNISVHGVQVIQYLLSGNIYVSDVLVSQGTDKNFVNGSK